MELIVTSDGVQFIEVHDRADCEGRATRALDADEEYRCCVHAPSAHPLRDRPLRWRADRQLMERVCAHNLGHPDPDDLRVRYGFDPGVHACDGCCHEDAS